MVWFSENASEVEAIDEYIVEFDDKKRQFVASGGLGPWRAGPSTS